jgi:hypothetical protein
MTDTEVNAPARTQAPEREKSQSHGTGRHMWLAMAIFVALIGSLVGAELLRTLM